MVVVVLLLVAAVCSVSVAKDQDDVIPGMTSEQQILLRSFKHWVAHSDESTTRERVDLFEIWQRTNPNDEATQAFYDAWAPVYDVDMIGSAYVNPKSVADAVVAAKFAKNTAILDVGAGTGKGGLDLKEKGYTNMDATDGSAGMLALAKKTGVYGKLYQCLIPSDGSKFCDIPDESYDVVTSSGSFYPLHLQGHHLPSIVRVVKVGGTLILSGCPHNDQGVGLRAAIKSLESQEVIKVVNEEYISNWFDGEDGTLWKLQKMNPYKQEM